jgi:hypothetical protein
MAGKGGLNGCLAVCWRLQRRLGEPLGPFGDGGGRRVGEALRPFGDGGPEEMSSGVVGSHAVTSRFQSKPPFHVTLDNFCIDSTLGEIPKCFRETIQDILNAHQVPLPFSFFD